MKRQVKFAGGPLDGEVREVDEAIRVYCAVQLNHTMMELGYAGPSALDPYMPQVAYEIREYSGQWIASVDELTDDELFDAMGSL